MSTSRNIVAMLALGSLSLSLAATAATITYSNEATFVAETGSALLTLPDANNEYNLTITGELTIAKVADGGFYAGTDIGTYWDKAPNYTVKSGIESFDLIPLKPIYAIGFSLYEPTSTARLNGCNKVFCVVNSTFEIELFSDVASLGKYTISPPNDEFAFYGYWTADRIAKVTIREAVFSSPSAGILSDDNEFFGRFMTGTTSNVAEPPPVPLPAAGWLLLSGLGGLGVLGRRRKAA